MDSDLLATMGIGGFGKPQKKKPTAGPPPQQQARHDAARRPTAATSAPVGRPISNFRDFFFYDEFCVAPRVAFHLPQLTPLPVTRRRYIQRLQIALELSRHRPNLPLIIRPFQRLRLRPWPNPGTRTTKMMKMMRHHQISPRHTRRVSKITPKLSLRLRWIPRVPGSRRDRMTTT